jgi:hypothetical protein
VASGTDKEAEKDARGRGQGIYQDVHGGKMISYSRLGLDTRRYQKMRREDRQQGKRGLSILNMLILLAFLVVLAVVIR